MAKKKTKKDSQRGHARRRLAERFGIRITNAELDALANNIRQGIGECLGRQSNRVTIWKIELEGRLMKCAYDKRTKEIVTFMPMDYRDGAAL